MIWLGRYNAILIIAFIIAVALSFAFEAPQIAITTTILIIFIRISVWILNLVKTAVTGKPLVYDTKIMDEDKS